MYSKISVVAIVDMMALIVETGLTSIGEATYVDQQFNAHALLYTCTLCWRLSDDDHIILPSAVMHFKRIPYYTMAD